MTDSNAMYEALATATVVDEAGEKVGEVGQLFLDDQTHRPSWVTVKTGLLGGKEVFVPCEGSDLVDNELRVPYSQSFITDAPGVGAEGHLDRADEDRLYAYYRIDTRTAEARDQTQTLHDHVPASQRDTDGADFNNTAGLHEERPGIDAERQSDADGGMDKPVVPAAQSIPPEVGAHGRQVTNRQGDGTSGFGDGQGLSGQGSSKQHTMRSSQQDLI